MSGSLCYSAINMAEPLKNFFNPSFVNRLASEMKKTDTNFDEQGFVSSVLSAEWESLELKARANKIAVKLVDHLPYSFPEQMKIVLAVAPKFTGYPGTVFPTIVEMFGIEHPIESIKALKELTAYSTSEFAIRPFLKKYPETIQTLLAWSSDENYHVRRLASEGCRPLLPWAMKLEQYVRDPQPLIPILENLKNDEEDYVYRSVANNLNDISKHHPALVLKLCTQWMNDSKTTRWVAKHALRTLLKSGNQEAMRLFGFGSSEALEVIHFNVTKRELRIGESTHFSFKTIHHGTPAKFRFEYCIGYLKKNGQNNEKVFQIKETELAHKEELEVEKKIDFKNLSTRKHYPGKHYITLKVNGIAHEQIEFTLV